MIYGTDFIGVGASDLLVNLLVLPLMVGIIQSLLQMILTVQYSSSAGMVVVFMMLVVSSYYGSRYLPHGYAMITRFFSSDGADALSVRFGLLYLTIWIIALWVIGYIIVRKKMYLAGNREQFCINEVEFVRFLQYLSVLCKGGLLAESAYSIVYKKEPNMKEEIK